MSVDFRRQRKIPIGNNPSQFQTISTLAQERQIEVPEYTEKKAQANQPGLHQKPLKQQVAVQYEVTSVGDNSFVNIVKQDEERQYKKELEHDDTVEMEADDSSDPTLLDLQITEPQKHLIANRPKNEQNDAAKTPPHENI